jgi:predicted HTH transcriptional regulator
MAEITTEEWLSELDQVAALCDIHVIPESRGFTAKQLSARLKVKRTTGDRRIEELIQQGVIRAIGYRPGRGKAAVYELAGD